MTVVLFPETTMNERFQFCNFLDLIIFLVNTRAFLSPTLAGFPLVLSLNASRGEGACSTLQPHKLSRRIFTLGFYLRVLLCCEALGARVARKEHLPWKVIIDIFRILTKRIC